jgi:enoyl-CoA hydratase
MERIRYSSGDGVAVLTLARPEKRNAVDPAMAREIEAAIDRYEADDDVRVAVLDAEIAPGRPVFCAGHDLEHFRTTFGTPQEDDVTTVTGGFAGVTRKARVKPLIAAVDGLATAGGCEMVLACDLVVASRRASFGIAEARWNLIAGGGGAFRLPRVVGPKVAMDMLLTAEPISAERAYQLGLVSRLVDDGGASEAALGVARTIAGNGPLAVRVDRSLVGTTWNADEETAWRLLDEASALVHRSADTREGLTAFAERRAPRWSGR